MRTDCDVLVIGGGTAGTAAAVAAARGGGRTVLVEKERFLGGTGYAGLLQHICGLYLNSEAMPAETLDAGIPREIEQELLRRAPNRSIKKIGRVYVLPYSREELQSILRELCSAEQNLDLYDDTAAVSVETGENSIKTVTLQRGRSKYPIIPKIVIDCSGSGVFAALAGASFDLSAQTERQFAGYIIKIAGLKNVDENLSIKVPYHLAAAVKQERFDPSVRFTVFSAGEVPGEGYCKLSIDGEDGPERDEQARKHGVEVHRYLSSVLPEFSDSSITGASFKVLDREGRRIRGEYTLTKEDVQSAAKFPDGVVRNAWPIELWDRSKGTVYKYVPRGDYYEIPFRCMKVMGIANLLTAGRCISVTREALGSTRVMGTCMALGEQAGKAAAYWVKNGKYPEGRF